jgi:hypothetical protein
VSALTAHISSGDPVPKILFVLFDSALFLIAATTAHRYEEQAITKDPSSTSKSL